jgi:RNA polymerase sigma-70 factor (ECF subfamily)
MEATSQVLGRLAVRRLGDAGLFERAARGDAMAFSEVYRRYQKRVYGFCLARTTDPGAAADATQEVFLRLLRSAPGEIESPKAWLFTVARNIATDSMRKISRLRESGGIDETSPAWASLAAADTADDVLGRSEGTTVFLALRSLSARHRTALILREIHGQSSKDMAEAMGSTPGAVDTLVSRARDAFGVAYARATDLPAACRSAVELMYRQRGSGITPQQRSGLEAHMAACERCRSEAKKSDDPQHLPALLPFLLPAQRAGGILHRLALAGQPFSDVVAQTGVTIGSQPHAWNLATKVAAGLLVATLVAVPVAGTVAHRSVAAGASASAAASRARESGSRATGIGPPGFMAGGPMGGPPANGRGPTTFRGLGIGANGTMVAPMRGASAAGGAHGSGASRSRSSASGMATSRSAMRGGGSNAKRATRSGAAGGRHASKGRH